MEYLADSEGVEDCDGIESGNESLSQSELSGGMGSGGAKVQRLSRDFGVGEKRAINSS